MLESRFGRLAWRLGRGYIDDEFIIERIDRMANDVAWPAKTRELHNHHFDSTIWNDLAFRDDDIVIATYAKSGTTWVQQIVAQMLFGGDAELAVAELSPWMDLRVPPKQVKLPLVEAQSHRRFLKTHRQSTRSRFRRERSTCISAGTGATSCGACTTIMRTPTRCGTTR
jgi:hypothetical protein